MELKRSIVITGVVVLVVLVLSGGLLYQAHLNGRQTQRSPLVVPNTEAPIAKLNSTPVLEGELNWLTYTGSSGAFFVNNGGFKMSGYRGYSFKYPPDWVLDEGRRYFSFKLNKETVEVRVDVGGHGTDAVNYKDVINNELRKYSGGLVVVTQGTRTGNSVVDGTYGFVMDSNIRTGPGPFFSFEVHYPSSVDKEFHQLFDRVLSTVQFTK